MNKPNITLAILLMLVLAVAPPVRGAVYRATKDTCFNKGVPNNYYGTAAYLPRAEKGGDPYWDVANGFLLMDFDRAAILNDIETQLGHPGTPPTLTELSQVTLNLNVMSREDKTATLGVPALILSATDTNWTEAGVGYYGVDVAAGGTTLWMDQNGLEVASLRDVLKHNDQMDGGLIRNATGQAWAPADTYTTWKLDPAVILNFLSGTQGVAGITMVSDGPYYDDNGGAYARESTNPYRGPYLELVATQATPLAPVFRSAWITTNSFYFSADLPPNFSYTIEKCPALGLNGVWTFVEQFTSTNSGATTRSYPLDARSPWFYRIKR
jgi:hypothetical protein